MILKKRPLSLWTICIVSLFLLGCDDGEETSGDSTPEEPIIEISEDICGGYAEFIKVSDYTFAHHGKASTDNKTYYWASCDQVEAYAPGSYLSSKELFDQIVIEAKAQSKCVDNCPYMDITIDSVASDTACMEFISSIFPNPVYEVVYSYMVVVRCSDDSTDVDEPRWMEMPSATEVTPPVENPEACEYVFQDAGWVCYKSKWRHVRIHTWTCEETVTQRIQILVDPDPSVECPPNGQLDHIERI